MSRLTEFPEVEPNSRGWTEFLDRIPEHNKSPKADKFLNPRFPTNLWIYSIVGNLFTVFKNLSSTLDNLFSPSGIYSQLSGIYSWGLFIYLPSGDLLCSGIYNVRGFDSPKFRFHINLWIYSRQIHSRPSGIYSLRLGRSGIYSGIYRPSEIYSKPLCVYPYIREFIPDLLGLILDEN